MLGHRVSVCASSSCLCCMSVFCLSLCSTTNTTHIHHHPMLSTLLNHIILSVVNTPRAFKILGDVLVTVVWAACAITMAYGLAFYTFGTTVKGNYQYFTAISWAQTAKNNGRCYVDMMQVEILLACVMSLFALSCVNLWLDTISAPVPSKKKEHINPLTDDSHESEEE